jgi:hypothetical protein
MSYTAAGEQLLLQIRPMRRSSDPFSLSLERPPIMHLLIYIFFRRLLVVLSFIPIIIKTLAMVILPE